MDVQGSVFVYSGPVCGKPGAVLVLTEVQGGQWKSGGTANPLLGLLKLWSDRRNRFVCLSSVSKPDVASRPIRRICC